MLEVLSLELFALLNFLVRFFVVAVVQELTNCLPYGFAFKSQLSFGNYQTIDYDQVNFICNFLIHT